MDESISFNLNGKPLRLIKEGDHTLLWLLRSDLGLTGAKYGCGGGYCGACTVLVDGKPVKSCRYPIRDLRGRDVVTIEGIAADGNLHPVQKAFIEHNAMQCGYCTPGMILSACSLLGQNPQPTREEIIDGMEGNLCRCGTYSRVIEAIQTAAKVTDGEGLGGLR